MPDAHGRATPRAVPRDDKVIEPERQCCPVLRFVVTAEPDGGPVWLELSGPAATKEFLRGLLNLAWLLTAAAST